MAGMNPRNSSYKKLENEKVLVPRACTLDGFTAEVSSCEGLYLRDLEPIATLAVRTMNSLYRLVVLQPPTRVLVQGGAFFPDPTEVTLCGSSLGGSCLKMEWIGPGFRMEIYGPTGRIVTSPVRSISIPLAGGGASAGALN
ncbi:MAG: hypothetical protein ACRD3C_19085 [Vicinamibacterales bacterium]